MSQPGGDPAFAHGYLRFVALLVLLPLSLLKQLYDALLQWLSPKPLTWEWDTVRDEEFPTRAFPRRKSASKRPPNPFGDLD